MLHTADGVLCGGINYIAQYDLVAGVCVDQINVREAVLRSCSKSLENVDFEDSHTEDSDGSDYDSDGSDEDSDYFSDDVMTDENEHASDVDNNLDYLRGR